MQKNRILIVEDDEIIALSLRKNLESSGYEIVDILDNAEDAIKVASDNKPDLVLMDIQIEGKLDGVTTAIKIRQDLDIPSIFLSAYVDDPKINRAKKAYPIGYIQKPIPYRTLFSTIEVGLYKEEMKKKILKYEKKLITAQKIANLSYWEWNVKDNTCIFSENALELFNIPDNYFVDGKFSEKFINLIHPKDRDRIINKFNELVFKEDTFQMEFRTVVASKMKYIYMILEVIEKEDKTPVKIFGTFQDITKRKEIELELLSKEQQLDDFGKYESLCQIVGDISHDIINQLTAISGNIELLKWENSSNVKHYDKINVIIESLNKTSSLAKQLLTFNKNILLSISKIDLNNHIIQLSELLKIQSRNHSIVFSLSKDKLYINAEPSKIQWVLLELIRNSVEAMPNPGIIEISTSSEFISNQGKLPEGEYIKLQVKDTGYGMDEETLDHAFDPYYSSKMYQDHAGLGLTIVSGIIKQLKGEIDIKTRQKQGTTISIYLPKPEDMIQTNKSSKPKLNGIIRGKTNILIIEDSSELKDFFGTVFYNEPNYNIIHYKFGKNGISAYEKLIGYIDLIILDILLPDILGTEILEIIKELNPKQKIIITSGIFPKSDLQMYLNEYVHFIQKPFKVHQLLNMVKNLIENSSDQLL